MHCLTLLSTTLQVISGCGCMLSSDPEIEAILNQQNRLVEIIVGDQKAKSLLYAYDSLM